MAELTLIRGVPGTGKSTKAKKLASTEVFGAVILEADMYFTAQHGIYEFDFQKLRWAHDWCLTTCKILLREDHQVIVANTFTTWQEIKPYIAFAVEIGIVPTIVTLTKEYGSIHGVPADKMDVMRGRFASHQHIMDQYELLKSEAGTNQ